MNLTSDLISGQVKFDELHFLPVPDINFLVGHDLIASKVDADPIINVSLESSVHTEKMKKDFSRYFSLLCSNLFHAKIHFFQVFFTE